MKSTKYTILLALVFLIPMGITNAMSQEVSDTDIVDENANQTIAIQIQPNNIQNIPVNELKLEFKKDIRELLRDIDAKDFEAKSNELKSEYDEFFRVVIEQVRISSGTGDLTDEEIAGAMDYIFYETIKDEKRKALEEQARSSSNNAYVSFLEWIGIQTANAVCPSTTNPNYKQLRLDIDGGIYHDGYLIDWSFNGDNDLYDTSHLDNARTCERVYTLSFLDEDHPFADAFYDDLRSHMYGRVHDIESFTIQNNNRITFHDDWSSSNSYDCLFGGLVGCHATITKSYIPGQTIYVSNTWNHMMDTSDTNRDYPKVSVP